MAQWQFHVSIWQDTVAPDDPGSTAQKLEDWLNSLGDQHWDIIQVDTHAMVNNIFRGVAFCRKSGAVVKSEADEAAKVAEPPEADEEPAEKPAGKRHR